MATKLTVTPAADSADELRLAANSAASGESSNPVETWIPERRDEITHRINGTEFDVDGVTVVNDADNDAIPVRVTGMGTVISSLVPATFNGLADDAARIEQLRANQIIMARNQRFILNAMNLALTTGRWAILRIGQLWWKVNKPSN